MELPSMEVLLIYIIITAYACWSTIGIGVRLGFITYTGKGTEGSSKAISDSTKVTNDSTKPKYKYKQNGHGYEFPAPLRSGSDKSSATTAAAPSNLQTPTMIFNTMNLFSPISYDKGTENEKFSAEDVVSAEKKKSIEAAAWAREYPLLPEVSDIKLARMTQKYNKVRKENDELKESRDYDVKENDRLNALVKLSAQDKVAIWSENRTLREELKQLQIKVHNTRTVDDFWHLINRKMDRSKEEVEQMIRDSSRGTLQDDIVAKMKGLEDVRDGLQARIGQLEAEIVKLKEDWEREAERRVQEIKDEADRRMIGVYEQRHQMSKKLHDCLLQREAEQKEIAALKKNLDKKQREAEEQERRAKVFNEATNERHIRILEEVEDWLTYKAEWEQKNRIWVRKLWHHTTAGQRQYWQDLCEEEGMDIGSVVSKLIQGCMEKDRVIGRVVDERDEERRRHVETKRRLGRSQLDVLEARVRPGTREEGALVDVEDEYEEEYEEEGAWESEGDWEDEEEGEEGDEDDLIDLR